MAGLSGWATGLCWHGAYAMFGMVILTGWDPVPSILIAGVATYPAIPTAFLRSASKAPISQSDMGRAEVTRLSVAQWKQLAAALHVPPRSATKNMGR